MRFIGSKERLIPFIEQGWAQLVGPDMCCVGDLFCGTGAASRLFKRLGSRVVACDNLVLGYTFACAALKVSEEPGFERLWDAGEVPPVPAGDLVATRYDRVLMFLSGLPGEDGFFFREYSPGGTGAGPFPRRYFSDENAKKIDAIRGRISRWKGLGLLEEHEACLLLSDLMRAANRVANIAGTYGAFIRGWDKRALRPLRLHRSAITAGAKAHEVFCMDANLLALERSFDAVYLDPPYTWRHYGAYYHILETIARGDEPPVSGRTGLRPWEDSRSRYCQPSEAADALRELVTRVRAAHIVLSYNSEGLISHEEILKILSVRGSPVALEGTYRRYRSNSGGTRCNTVKERLYHVRAG